MKIGCDLVSIARIEKIYQKHGEKFLDKFLDADEQKLFKTSSSLAGLWAAKEAAISLECSFFDIKISKDSKNAPKLDFSQKILKNFKIQTASLSISHDFGFAMAVVIVG